MRASLLLAVVPVVLLVSASAEAHFNLEQPADWLQTDATGTPLGTNGTQKMNPCGEGTASGLITQVRAGSMLHIKLTEEIPHGGHYRVALLPKYNIVSSDIPEPTVTLDANGDCSTAAIENPVVAPVLADNLFPHTQANATPGQVWETDVTLPNETGPATLQIIEFMTPHAPQCFYHHCAQLEIVSADAGAGDGGVVVVGPDGGATGEDGGGIGAGSDSGGGGGGGNGSNANSGASSGCSAGGSTAPSSMALGALGLAIASIARRRSRGSRKRLARREV